MVKQLFEHPARPVALDKPVHALGRLIPEPVHDPANPRFLHFARSAWYQLSCTWTRRFIVGAAPLCWYFGVTWYDYQRTRFNFRLQQAEFFRFSLSCIADSPDVRDIYGKNIKLEKATFGSISSGFNPFLKERHIWVGFHGNNADGWVRLGLRRTDFDNSTEKIKEMRVNMENKLKHEMKETIQRVNAVTNPPEEEEEGEGDTPTETPELVLNDGGGSTARQLHSDRNEEHAVKSRLTQQQNQMYISEMRRLYPTLPETFGKNDLEQAIEVKRDKEVEGALFDSTWQMECLSIHPDVPGEVPDFVLYDPDDMYTNQADYLIDTNWISIKKPENSRASKVERKYVSVTPPARVKAITPTEQVEVSEKETPAPSTAELDDVPAAVLADCSVISEGKTDCSETLPAFGDVYVKDSDSHRIDSENVITAGVKLANLTAVES